MNDNQKASLDRLLELWKRGTVREETFPCRCAAGRGMTEVSSDGRGIYRPCERCNPRTFKSFRNGCLASGHRGCERCAPGQRRGSEVFS